MMAYHCWGSFHQSTPVFNFITCGGHWNKGENTPPSWFSSEGGGSRVVAARIEEMPSPQTCVSSEGGSKGVVVGVVNDLKHK